MDGDVLGGEMDLWKFFFAFLFVLILIGAAAWLVRRFGSSNVNASANRGRMPRLAVIDATAVDSRRRLVLVRRDNVEHLLMIGGPSDIVVEPNIQRAPAAAPIPGSRGMSGALGDAPSWSDTDLGVRPDPVELDVPIPAPEPPPRGARQIPERPVVPQRHASERPPLERRTDPFAGLAAEAGLRPDITARHETSRNEPMLRPEPLRHETPADLRSESLHTESLSLRAEPPRQDPPLRPEPAIRTEPAAPLAGRAPAPDFSAKPPPRPAAPPAPPVAPAARPAQPVPSVEMSDDQNLAEMAQRLEAALRRPGADPRPATAPATPPIAERIGAPPVAPEAPAAKPAPSPAKTDFKSLEDEMASLLGRPKNPS